MNKKQEKQTKVIMKIEELGGSQRVKMWVDGKRIKNPVVFITLITPSIKY